MRLKTKYEFIHFVENSIKGQKTQRWECVRSANGIYIGMVRWHGGWWSYIFYPEEGSSYDAKCFRDIADFMDNLTKRQRESWRKKKTDKKPDLGPDENTKDAIKELNPNFF